jgi:hypothetical protein
MQWVTEVALGLRSSRSDMMQIEIETKKKISLLFLNLITERRDVIVI